MITDKLEVNDQSQNQESMESNYELLLMQRIFIPATCKYKQARVME
jgi:hypothetical protein